MKEKILALAVIAICGSIAAGGTLAYFNAETKAHNVITAGEVNIELIEKRNPYPGTEFEDFEGLPDFEDKIGVMPGASVSKMVAVKNTGDADAWIRVKVATRITDPVNGAANQELPNDVVSYDFNTTEWEKIGDYFYYLQPVSADGVTERLFENVIFAKTMGNEYQNCRVEIDVEAEAMQVANNELQEGEDITSVWPEFWSTMQENN